MKRYYVWLFGKYHISFLLILLFILNSSFIIPAFKVDVFELLDNMQKESRNIKSLQLTLLIKERIDDKYETHQSDFKINYSPFKFYMKEKYPREGLEVMFIDGQNNGKAWIHTNTFPWTTISLYPLSNTMRNGQHHSIYKTGFAYFLEVLDHMQTKYNDKLKDMVEYNGIVKYNNIISHKITFTNPYFKYVYYTVEEGDNLEKLSYKLKVSDFMIKKLNPDISAFDYLEKGKKIKVPNDYGASFIIYIEEKTNLLIGVKAFDDKGLWEEYSYSGIKVNPAFTSQDFDIKNPAYNF